MSSSRVPSNIGITGLPGSPVLSLGNLSYIPNFLKQKVYHSHLSPEFLDMYIRNSFSSEISHK